MNLGGHKTDPGGANWERWMALCFDGTGNMLYYDRSEAFPTFGRQQGPGFAAMSEKLGFGARGGI